jgi:hypothetical protein
VLRALPAWQTTATIFSVNAGSAAKAVIASKINPDQDPQLLTA